MISKRLLIHGKVQGVGYREALRHEAQRRGVMGWVRNRADGSVEAVLQGPEDQVGALIAWASRGPPASRVDEVQIEALEETATYTRFERRPSA